MRSRLGLIAALALAAGPSPAFGATFKVVLPDEILWADGRPVLSTQSNGFDVLWGTCNPDGSFGTPEGGTRLRFDQRSRWINVNQRETPCLQVRVLDTGNRWIGTSRTYDLRRPEDFQMPMPPIILNVTV